MDSICIGGKMDGDCSLFTNVNSLVANSDFLNAKMGNNLEKCNGSTAPSFFQLGLFWSPN